MMNDITRFQSLKSLLLGNPVTSGHTVYRCSHCDELRIAFAATEAAGKVLIEVISTD